MSQNYFCFPRVEEQGFLVLGTRMGYKNIWEVYFPSAVTQLQAKSSEGIFVEWEFPSPAPLVCREGEECKPQELPAVTQHLPCSSVPKLDILIYLSLLLEGDYYY